MRVRPMLLKAGGVFVLLVLASCTLSGCWDRIEVNDLATITAVGIDQYSDNLIELSLQIYTPPQGSSISMQGGGSKGSSSQNQSTVISATGINFADAVSKVQEKVPRLLFWGQNEVFVFSHSAAKQDIAGHMDYILRVPQIRGSALVFVSRTKAKDVLALTPQLRSSSADVLEEVSNLKIGLAMSAGNFNIMLSSSKGTAIMPSIEIMPAPEGQPQKRYPAITGCAVFKDSKLAGYIDDNITRGVMWFRNEIDMATATIVTEDQGGIISARLNRGRTRLKPRISNGIWEMTVGIDTREILVQNTSNTDVAELKGTRIVEEGLKQEIEKRMNRTLQIVQKKFEADVFGFAEAFHRKYPKIWNKEKGNWEEIFPHVQVKYDIKTVIVNPGKRTVPTNRMEGEKG
ncbi:Ger(x)C family spore germination protein [Paenibacillus oenotherae]|uniref:Ger(X)C family spore germination protein n=1 Tax=Paenibacillus oenotherae TaxID=1435645 RepID=A0ABS7DAY8_9BACL|nr:Ger(x)C family spore germination protein [Paenibacillus oenotherae]MBW7477110.1 Ger(x)C family spore germination protein [Paenibacillus oenotherae]